MKLKLQLVLSVVIVVNFVALAAAAVVLLLRLANLASTAYEPLPGGAANVRLNEANAEVVKRIFEDQVPKKEEKKEAAAAEEEKKPE